MGIPWQRALAACVVSLAIVGCGSSGDSSADTAAVKQTVSRVLHALGSGDGATVCALATKDGQAALAKAVPHSTCAQVVQLVGAHLSPTQKAGLESAKIGKVTLNGHHASVPDSSITSAKGSLKGFLESGSAPTQLTKQSDGSWRISG